MRRDDVSLFVRLERRTTRMNMETPANDDLKFKSMQLQYRKPHIWISHTKILQLDLSLIYKVAARISV